jgi:hypothetical protein
MLFEEVASAFDIIGQDGIDFAVHVWPTHDAQAFALPVALLCCAAEPQVASPVLRRE